MGLFDKGYPAKLRWKEGRGPGSGGSGHGSVQISQQSDAMALVATNAATAPGERLERLFNTGSSQGNNFLHQNTPSAVAVSRPLNLDTASFDGYIGTVYSPGDYPQRLQLPLVPGSAYSPGGYEEMRQPSMITGATSLGTQDMQTRLLARSPPPRPLPYPISGINTPYQKKMFHHFTSVLSYLLTTSNGSSNPMNEVIVPLATADWTMMKTLLSLSGSHLLKISDAGKGMKDERDRLCAGAVHMQALRKHKLLEWSTSDPATRPEYSLKDQEILLGTSLLLCLNELCVGSKDKKWQEHLDMARHAITLLSTSSNDTRPRQATHRQRIVTEVNPVLLEFFTYHDSLATVTIPSLIPRPQYVHKIEGSDLNVSLISDALMHFINRIAPLRAEPQIGIVMSQAASISNDLEKWKPHHSFSKDQKMISEFYKWALSIWLYSILHPEDKANPEIQDHLPAITAEMQDISDDVKACLLFPLFIVGGAAITEKDRTVVRCLFQRLEDWSSLGNIEVALTVVENMWMDHDKGLPKAWDWVTQLQKCGMTLLVT